ncbi:hypothetical protein BBP40_007664 [Aspergillus hancockii]|nr:hypothetical protein BBP40_007664 [Aspergillus hancockii]
MLDVPDYSFGNNLNELLLLTVQSVCNNQSIKIPWSEVASTMKDNVTEGAIVQHLAKLRPRRVAIGRDVPSALRRGGVGSSNKSSDVTSGTKRRIQSSQSPGSEEDEGFRLNLCDDSPDEDYVDKGRHKSRRKKQVQHRKKQISQPRGTTQIEYEDGVKQESESSDSVTGELLVPGADFLQYPKDVELPHVPTSSQEASESKVIVLRYRRSVEEHYSGLASAYDQSVARALQTYEIHQQTPYHQPGPSFGNIGFSPMSGPISNMPSFGEILGFPSYSNYQNPVFYDEPTGLTSEMVGSTGNPYSSEYHYLHGSYTDPNESSLMDHQDNEEMKG